MSKTAKQMIQELANRLGELILCTATSNGSRTTLLSTDLESYFPAQTSNLHSWVYGLTGTAGNIGREARSTTWNPTTDTLTLISPGFPSSTADDDTFEIHLKTRRSRKLEAINDAVGQLGLLWYRRFVDTSITTTENTWSYTLPSNVARLVDVELQVNTEHSTFPYEDVRHLNWTVRESTSTAGVLTQTLQFGEQPPEGRILRLHCEGWFTDLAADTDVLALTGNWERVALAWIYDWAKYRIFEEMVEEFPTGDYEKYRQRALDKLVEARQRVIELTRPHEPGRIVVPGTGDGRFREFQSSRRWEYLGAFDTP